MKIDAAFICLPNHLHTKYIKILVEKKIHEFLEKPGGINLSDYKDLIKIQKKIKKYNLKVMVGYHLRFHPIISKLKKIINDKSIGIILNVLVENGEHIADYRTYQKYWKRYHAKKKQGGGVLLNQIHEIDYLLDLFENYNFKVVNTFRRKMSNLKIDTEDTISSNFIVKKFKNVFLLSLLMNSYERPQKRTIKIIGTKGKVIFDFLKNEIEIYKFNIFKNGMIKSKKIYTKFLKYKINRNDLFKKEVYYFINAVKKNKLIDKKFGLKKSIKTLNIALQLNICVMIACRR